MTEHYIVQVDSGMMTIFHAEFEEVKTHSHFHIFGTVPPEELPPALAVGLEMLGLIRDDQEIDDNAGVVHPGHADQGGPEFLRIWLKDKEPIPLTGLAYLRSLPGCVIYYDEGYEESPFVIVRKGLLWVGEGADVFLWAWDGSGKYDGTDWRELPWVQEASEKTISPWTPEEK